MAEDRFVVLRPSFLDEGVDLVPANLPGLRNLDLDAICSPRLQIIDGKFLRGDLFLL